MIACWICCWVPQLPDKSRQRAATQAQPCFHCGATLYEHSDDHPHGTALCQGFEVEAWPSERRTQEEPSP
jgi:hypothetical protein